MQRNNYSFERQNYSLFAAEQTHLNFEFIEFLFEKPKLRIRKQGQRI